jgi:hypothetical protein
VTTRPGVRLDRALDPRFLRKLGGDVATEQMFD